MARRGQVCVGGGGSKQWDTKWGAVGGGRQGRTRTKCRWSFYIIYNKSAALFRTKRGSLQVSGALFGHPGVLDVGWGTGHLREVLDVEIAGMPNSWQSILCGPRCSQMCGDWCYLLENECCKCPWPWAGGSWAGRVVPSGGRILDHCSLVCLVSQKHNFMRMS